jgi:hypothetical protein
MTGYATNTLNITFEEKALLRYYKLCFPCKKKDIQIIFQILHMRFVKILIPLVLCLAAIRVLSLWLSNREDKLHGFSCSPLLLFSVLNTIVIAILVLSYGSYSEEVDRNWPILPPPYEGDAKWPILPLPYEGDAKLPILPLPLPYEGDAKWPILPTLYERYGKGDTGDYSEDEEEYNGSDGYEEDNDDDDDDSDDEEYENLAMMRKIYFPLMYRENDPHSNSSY